MRADHFELKPGGIFLVNAAGGGLRRISTTMATSVDWSPDGRSLAFVGRNGRVGILALRPPAVARFRVSGASQVAWSPDGRQLAIAGRRGISIVTARGQPKATIRTAHTTTGVTWAPDGRQLAVASWRTHTGPSTIYVLDASGLQRRELTTTPAGGYAPDWKR